jgi:hypothetical protein
MSQAHPIPHPWRRFLGFSVRGLIVVVLAIGAGLGWIVHQAHVQRDAVAAIEENGGGVGYSWEWRDGNRIPGGKPWAPRWLVELVGVDYFVHVTAVWLFSTSKAPDATLAQVGRLTRLQALFDYSSSVSDAGLAHLTGLIELSLLSLPDTRVTDGGLAPLKGLTKLTQLDLSRTRVTDAGLSHLTGLRELSRLGLGGTQITHAGLVHLQGSTNLSVLVLISGGPP